MKLIVQNHMDRNHTLHFLNLAYKIKPSESTCKVCIHSLKRYDLLIFSQNSYLVEARKDESRKIFGVILLVLYMFLYVRKMPSAG